MKKRDSTIEQKDRNPRDKDIIAHHKDKHITAGAIYAYLDIASSSGEAREALPTERDVTLVFRIRVTLSKWCYSRTGLQWS
jgi:hypothetical protein